MANSTTASQPNSPQNRDTLLKDIDQGAFILQDLAVRVRDAASGVLNAANNTGANLGNLSVEEIAKRVQTVLAVLKGSSETVLRGENRIQDDPQILGKLGFKGNVPPITEDLLNDCVRTGGTLVLRFKTNLVEIQKSYNERIVSVNRALRLEVRDVQDLEIRDHKPSWVILPSKVKEETIGKYGNYHTNTNDTNRTCSPMEMVLMLGYNYLATGAEMPGYKGLATFASQNTTVGRSMSTPFVIEGHHPAAAYSGSSIGLAPKIQLGQKALV